MDILVCVKLHLTDFKIVLLQHLLGGGRNSSKISETLLGSWIGKVTESWIMPKEKSRSLTFTGPFWKPRGRHQCHNTYHIWQFSLLVASYLVAPDHCLLDQSEGGPRRVYVSLWGGLVHVWYVYLLLFDFFVVNVGKYTLHDNLHQSHG